MVSTDRALLRLHVEAVWGVRLPPILWTRAVIEEGLVPLYSALAENTASLLLAAAAGYRVFAQVAIVEG